LSGGATSDGGREPLPVLRAAERIVECMRGGAMVLTAATGSGKTTQVPQILARSGAVDGEIVVLEPRRLAARMTARRVAEEMGVRLGDEVGFQTRFERMVGPRTRIRFVTEGVFLRQAQRDPLLQGVGCVLLDEFHERSVFADLALGVVRAARERRPGLLVAAMSATMDAGQAAAYLGAPVVTAEGRAFPVAVRYDPGDSAPVWERAARAVRALVEEGNEGDALVFMPGAFEIDRTVDAVRAELRAVAGGGAFDVVPLHGSMPPDRQDQAVAPPPRGRRKVIVATNVAETSITIPGVRMVVDAGLARVFRVDPRRGLNALRSEPISRASADQRAGRAGRTAPGTCVRLWSERDHALRPATETPEVRRIDLAESMLMVLSMGFGPFESFPWLDAPEADAVARARGTLASIGAIEADGAITALGRRLARIPAHPRLGRVLVEAAELGVLPRAARWCAVAGGRDVVHSSTPGALLRLTPDGEPPSDVGAREELLRRVEASGFRSTRHEGVEASVAACREAAATAKELERSAEGAQAPAEPGTSAAFDGDSFARVSRAMLAGFGDHVGWRMDAQRPHCAMPGRRKVSIDPSSIQRGAGFVLALEVREGGRGDQVHQSLGMVTPVEQAWVEHAMPDRFETRTEVRFDESLGAPAEFEERLFDGIVVGQVVRPLRGRDAKAAAHEELAARVASGELRPASWDESVEQWIARVRCVAAWFPERALIRYDEDDLGVLAAEIAHGCARVSDLDSRPVLDILRNALSWDEQQFVEKAAPAAIALPKGWRMKLEYAEGKPPRGRGKIQDFYDFPGHPCVAGGRVKVVLELLGPNYRPVQVTEDLPGFWERLYPEVKKDLKRRYPRHEWR
jgi:ATP-dependent helicase HrpB